MSTTQALSPRGPAGSEDGHSPFRPVRSTLPTGGTTTDDLPQVLRVRLLVLLVMVASINSLFVIRALLAPEAIWKIGPWATLSAHPMAPANFAVAAVMWTSAVVIWRRRALSVSRLRVLELINLAVFVAFALAHNWYSTEGSIEREFLARPFATDTLAKSSCLLLSLVIIGYGVFIPNTWRRCLTVLCAIAALGMTVSTAALARYALPRDFLGAYITSIALYLGAATMMAVYGAHRISILRGQVREARRLDQYVLRERLGSGGMGDVFRADHALLRRPAAVKLIRPDRAGDPATLARFEREVQATASLSHPNTIQIFDYGRTDDGTFYYVMEYLDGPNLDELVQATGPLPPVRAIYLLRQVCMALREAHAVGLIHRDLKPNNVIVTRRGGLHDVAKLLDFGLVRPHVTVAGDAELTQEGTVTGTPAFMSPEQAKGQDRLDPRCDIYSLGATAYFMLTGRSPFGGRSHAAILAAHIYEAPELPDRLRPDAPADLQAVVLKCLAKNPDDRFPEASALEKALAECRDAREWSEDRAAEWWRSRNVTGPARSADGFARSLG